MVEARGVSPGLDAASRTSLGRLTVGGSTPSSAFVLVSPCPVKGSHEKPCGRAGGGATPHERVRIRHSQWIRLHFRGLTYVRLQWPQPQPVPNLAVRQRADSVVSANIAKPRRFAAVSRALWIHARLSCAFVAAMNHNNIAVLVLREINHYSLRLQPNPSINRTASQPVISGVRPHT